MKKKCFICNGDLKKNNHYSFKCLSCNFYFSNLKPSFGQDVSGIEVLRKKNFRKIIGVIKSIKKNPDILEIGSGDGYFIEECIQNKLSITGSEASNDSIFRLKNKFGKKISLFKLILPESIMSKTKKRYDVVIFNDVFEHLKDLKKVIINVSEILKRDGIIIVNLPSSDGIIFRISELFMKFGFDKFYNRLWQKNMNSPHLSYFNEKNLKQLFFNNKFINIKSGALDSLSMNNFERFRKLYKSSLIASIISISGFFFFIIQKFLPKDIIFICFKKFK